MLRGVTAASRIGAGATRGSLCTDVCFPRRFSRRNAAFSPNPKPSGRVQWRRLIVRGPAAGGRDDAEADDDEERPDAHLISRKELSDGTLIFSFGTEDDAKASDEETKSDAAPAPVKDEAAATAAAAHIEQEEEHAVEEEEFPADDAAQRLAQLAEDIDRIDDRIVEKITKSKPAAARKDLTPSKAQKSPKKKPQEAEKEAESCTSAKAAKQQTSATKAKASKDASPAPSHSADDLEALKMPELRALAKERSLRGYSKLRKAELIDLIMTGAQA